jgi:hypothetical protein
MAKTQQTPAQRERQRSKHRNAGRYAKVNPCDRCGRSAGVDYYSDPRHEQHGGYGLCLCEPCADMLASLSDESYAQAARLAKP